jgi:GAF domain-containing protein
VSLSSFDLVEIREKSPSSVPPPLPTKRSAPRRPEAVTALRSVTGHHVRERSPDLESQPDALAAARACLEALDLALPSRASLIHAFDAARRDFLVVHARGEGAESMVLQRSREEDPLLRIALPTGEPFPWNDLRKSPVNRLGRFTGLPRVTRVLACPLVVGGRWLGAIEIVDPAHGVAFRSQDVVAARTAAQGYARYVSSHGLVLDVADIARHAFRA